MVVIIMRITGLQLLSQNALISHSRQIPTPNSQGIDAVTQGAKPQDSDITPLLADTYNCQRTGHKKRLPRWDVRLKWKHQSLVP